jgi:hypothetical protein
VLGVARAGYYAWSSRPALARTWLTRRSRIDLSARPRLWGGLRRHSQPALVATQRDHADKWPLDP